MFTGIIEDLGRLENIAMKRGHADLLIRSERVCEDCSVDDSVAVNGICLTVTSVDPPFFTAQAGQETISRSTLGDWRAGMTLNLERAMKADGRLGGHIVQGHVDTVAEIISIRDRGDFRDFSIRIPREYARLTVEKGSISVDGVSLTIAVKKDTVLTLSLIPHSMNRTLFGSYRTGDTVNIETDILGRYIEELLKNKQPSLDRETLAGWGYKI